MPEDPTPAASSTPISRQERRRQLQKLREKLANERTAWSRWMPRLKRAFTAIVKIGQRIARLDRQIAKLNKS